MPIYALDLACRSIEHDYDPLFERLRRLKAQSLLGGRWLIDVREDLDVVTKAILGECAAGDGLFVTELTPGTRWTATGIGNEAKAWLLSRMVDVGQPSTPSHGLNPAKLN